MELPYGIRVKQQMAGWTLRELNSYCSEKSVTGYVLVRPQQDGNDVAVTGTIVYLGGLVVLGFISDGKTDRVDAGLARIEAMLSSKTAAVEAFKVREHQIPEIADAFKVPLPSVPGVAGQGLSGSPAVARPVLYPEAGGKFLKAVSVSEVQSYLQGASSFTGHAILVKKAGQANVEYHLLIVKGAAVAAYSASEGTAGAQLCNRLLSEAGVLELYYLDQPAVESLVVKYPHISLKAASQHGLDAAVGPLNSRPAAPGVTLRAVHRPAKVASEAVPVVEPAKPVQAGQPAEHSSSLAEPAGQGSLPQLLAAAEFRLPAEAAGRAPGEAKPLPVREPEQDEISDFDLDYVRNVEQEFTNNVKDLLKTYNLSYLCVNPGKKA